MLSNEVKFEITSPKAFTKKAVVVLNFYAALLAVPLLIAIPLLVFFDKYLQNNPAFILGMVTLALAVIIPIYFFPIGIGNPYIRRLVSSMQFPSQDGFIVQLIRSPRIRSGFWAFMEDADDIGQLSFGDEAIFFEGDSVKLFLPSSQIREVRLKNVGWRGLGIIGPRIIVSIQGLTDVNSFEFTERCSLSVPGSRRKTRELYQQISVRLLTK